MAGTGVVFLLSLNAMKERTLDQPGHFLNSHGDIHNHNYSHNGHYLEFFEHYSRSGHPESFTAKTAIDLAYINWNSKGCRRGSSGQTSKPVSSSRLVLHHSAGHRLKRP